MKVLADTDDPRVDLESKGQSGLTILHLAILATFSRIYSEERVQILLEKGADIDSRDSTVKTPLFYVAELSHVALVEILLARGADADEKDSVGRTPLSHA